MQKNRTLTRLSSPAVFGRQAHAVSSPSSPWQVAGGFRRPEADPECLHLGPLPAGGQEPGSPPLQRSEPCRREKGASCRVWREMDRQVETFWKTGIIFYWRQSFYAHKPFQIVNMSFFLSTLTAPVHQGPLIFRHFFSAIKNVWIEGNVKDTWWW